jgi:hypothetical protein
MPVVLSPFNVWGDTAVLGGVTAITRARIPDFAPALTYRREAITSSSSTLARSVPLALPAALARRRRSTISLMLRQIFGRAVMVPGVTVWGDVILAVVIRPDGRRLTTADRGLTWSLIPTAATHIAIQHPVMIHLVMVWAVIAARLATRLRRITTLPVRRGCQLIRRRLVTHRSCRPLRRSLATRHLG